MKVIRLNGYNDRETGHKLAKTDLSKITKIGLATKEDLPGIKLSYVDDSILCFIAKFELDGILYLIDILWEGESAYGAFKYANESKTAKKDAIKSIETWIECTTCSW